MGPGPQRERQEDRRRWQRAASWMTGFQKVCLKLWGVVCETVRVRSRRKDMMLKKACKNEKMRRASLIAGDRVDVCRKMNAGSVLGSAEAWVEVEERESSRGQRGERRSCVGSTRIFSDWAGATRQPLLSGWEGAILVQAVALMGGLQTRKGYNEEGTGEIGKGGRHREQVVADTGQRLRSQYSRGKYESRHGITHPIKSTADRQWSSN
jgi:hypothetical protein